MNKSEMRNNHNGNGFKNKKVKVKKSDWQLIAKKKHRELQREQNTIVISEQSEDLKSLSPKERKEKLKVKK
ncbi:MAG: hypothetical protein ABJF11_20300 [Reichenbachiella sp.]|uniref:hypothetical protein n=1 Tax=Reichenbachiella sp. TaxID=2184521 RepID=UPI003266823F